MVQYAYLRKQFMPLSDAKIGLLTNSFLYGATVFEGIRGNWNEEQKQIYIFRAKEHYERMHNNCKLMLTEIPPIDDLCEITKELVARSGFHEDVYIRPLAYKSSEIIGTRLHDLDCDFCAMVFPYGQHLASEKCRAGVSSWRRLTDNSSIPSGKVSGQYINSAFAKTEAIRNGFDEAILLNDAGYVAEACTENIFLVINGKLVTPSTCENILPGITRQSIMEIAENELNLQTIERRVERKELYLAQECFFTGTAAHITPVVEIDRRLIGDGNVGPITKELQALYQEVIRGKVPQYIKWCNPVY
jgi:branched-chain amino acid aminotransferase